MNRDAHWETLTQVFARVFGLDRIDETVSVESLKPWDSMAHIALILELEGAFGVSISTDQAIEMTSVPDILRMLDGKANI